MPDPEPCPYISTLQRCGEEDEPFLPNPLKSKVAHVHREPLSKATQYFYIKPIRTITINLTNALSHCRTNSLRRCLTELRDQSDVIYWLDGAPRQEKLRTENCLVDPGTNQ